MIGDRLMVKNYNVGALFGDVQVDAKDRILHARLVRLIIDLPGDIASDLMDIYDHAWVIFLLISQVSALHFYVHFSGASGQKFSVNRNICSNLDAEAVRQRYAIDWCSHIAVNKLTRPICEARFALLTSFMTVERLFDVSD